MWSFEDRLGAFRFGCSAGSQVKWRQADSVDETRRLNAGSLVMGILALLCVIPVAQVIIALMGIGLCTYALKRVKRAGGAPRAARVGLICSIAGLVIGVVVLAVLTFGPPDVKLRRGWASSNRHHFWSRVVLSPLDKRRALVPSCRN